MKSKIDTKKNFYGILPMYFVLLSLLNVAESAPCSEICGKFEQVPEDDALENICQSGNKSTQRTLNAEGALPTCSGVNQRIAHGYEPPDRGFIVAVIGYSRNDTHIHFRKTFICGGTLLNNKYVLTAGHCVCQNDHEIVPCDNGKPDYPIKKVFRVFVGFSPTMNLNEFKTLNGYNGEFGKPYRKWISKVKIHPKWKGSIQEDGPLVDIALIKLYHEDYIEFKDNIRPVCLPPIDFLDLLQIKNKFAYSAGWGYTEKDPDNCVTDNRGPVRNTKCRFPFSLVTNKGIKLNECQKYSFPSTKSQICIQFHKENPDFDWGELSFIQIRYQNIDDQTVVFGMVNCYRDKNVEDYGWCGTCVEGAEEGEEGYCPPNMYYNNATEGREEFEDLDNEITIVRLDTKWGFCLKDSACQIDYDEPYNTLKETMLTILTDEQCKAFLDGFEDPFSTETELCAGMKFKFPTYEIYDRSFVKKNKNGDNVYKFTINDTKIDYNVGIKEELRRFGFYLGFSDTCSGDSGGPLYQFHGEKVYQVGVVARGATEYCAEQNEPGIYTSLFNKETLEWIQSNSASGQC